MYNHRFDLAVSVELDVCLRTLSLLKKKNTNTNTNKQSKSVYRLRVQMFFSVTWLFGKLKSMACDLYLIVRANQNKMESKWVIKFSYETDMNLFFDPKDITPYNIPWMRINLFFLLLICFFFVTEAIGCIFYINLKILSANTPVTNMFFHLYVLFCEIGSTQIQLVWSFSGFNVCTHICYCVEIKWT